MDRPTLNFSSVPLLIQHYEKYLPTAFDESMTILEKMNKIIIHLNRIGELTSDAFNDWNTVIEWVMSDGLEASINAKLDEMAINGTLDEIINEHIFGELNTRITTAEETIVTHTNDIASNKTNIEINTSDIASNKTAIEEAVIQFTQDIASLQSDISKRGVLVTQYPSIQEALNVGGLVIFPNGVYNIGETLQIPSDTHVLGLGKVTLKRTNNINGIMVNKSNGAGGYNANNNITIENLTFDGNGDYVSGDVTLLTFGHCTNITIKNNHFIGNRGGWHDLEINGCQDVFVEGNTFDDYKGTSECVQLDHMIGSVQFPWFGPYDHTSCLNVVFSKNRFKGFERSRTCIGNHSFVVGDIHKNIKIVNNYFEEFTIALSLQDVHDFIIQDNYFFNCMKGVFYQEKMNDSRRWYLDRNVFINKRDFAESETELEGRFFEGYSVAPQYGLWDVYIRENHIEKCRTHGIGFTCNQGAIVSDNIIKESGSNGIYVFGGKDIMVSNNFITQSNTKGQGGRADIVIGNNDNVTAQNINVHNNNIASFLAGTNITSCLLISNIIKTSNNLDNGGVTSHNNMVAGAYVV